MVWLVLIATFAAYSVCSTSLRLFPVAQVSVAIYLSPPATILCLGAVFLAVNCGHLYRTARRQPRFSKTPLIEWWGCRAPLSDNFGWLARRKDLKFPNGHLLLRCAYRINPPSRRCLARRVKRIEELTYPAATYTWDRWMPLSNSLCGILSRNRQASLPDASLMQFWRLKKTSAPNSANSSFASIASNLFSGRLIGAAAVSATMASQSGELG